MGTLLHEDLQNNHFRYYDVGHRDFLDMARKCRGRGNIVNIYLDYVKFASGSMGTVEAIEAEYRVKFLVKDGLGNWVNML